MTILDVAGVPADPAYPLDGVSMRPVLQDASHRVERPLYWRLKHRDQRVLRDGPWKYLKVEANEYLFHLSADERERAKRAQREPGRLAAMRDAWLAWNASMPPVPDDATVSLGYTERDMLSL